MYRDEKNILFSFSVLSNVEISSFYSVFSPLIPINFYWSWKPKKNRTKKDSNKGKVEGSPL